MAARSENAWLNIELQSTDKNHMTGTDSSHATKSRRATKPTTFDGEAELSAYLEYNKILRSWFVAFGVGGPALFLINEQVGKRLAEKGQLKDVAAMFLIGTGSQVFGAMLNKICNWYVYRGANDAAYREKRRFKLSNWLVEQFWVDIVLDLVTILLFGFATWRLVTVFGSAP